MSKANKGRTAAIRALMAVDEGSHVEDTLDQHAPRGGPDRGLAWHLALGTLRWRGALDSSLQPFLKTPVDRLDPAVKWAMRMGLFEVHCSRTPSRAAVHQAVEVTKAVGFRRASGMVNAVLRRASGAPLNDDAAVCLPPWLYERWGKYEGWLKRIREPASISVCGTPPHGIEMQPAQLDGDDYPDIWTLSDNVGDITRLDGFDEGLFWVMDPSAAKVADLVSKSVGPSGRVLDACAAPGGKTFRMIQSGLDVTACDISHERLNLMNTNLTRLRMKAELSVHDWIEGPMGDVPLFDAVLVDAPCTGLGVVRRHPEIIWRRQPGDPAAMSVTQRVILKHAAAHVKPGGALIYSVCSMEPEEGVQVIESLAGWEVENRWASIPPIGDEDGFQVFVLRRLTEI